jgi:hypothetical protein
MRLQFAIQLAVRFAAVSIIAWPLVNAGAGKLLIPLAAIIFAGSFLIVAPGAEPQAKQRAKIALLALSIAGYAYLAYLRGNSLTSWAGWGIGLSLLLVLEETVLGDLICHCCREEEK